MSLSFLASYLDKVTSSVTNWHKDNYDYRRFGPEPAGHVDHSWRALARSYLRSVGWVPKWEVGQYVSAAVQLVEEELPRFQWLYERLADDESRQTLIDVLSYRALGYRKIKLPLNTSSYWDGLAQIEALVDPSDVICSGFFDWQLSLIDLGPLGLPIRLYDMPFGAYSQFVLEQYRCRRDGSVDIAANPGDYIIDAGACWGDTALYFANRCGVDGRVYSYEFMTENLGVLARNLTLNPGLSDRISVIDRAAWDESDVILSTRGDGPGTTVNRDETDAASVGPLTLTIDDLVHRQRLPRVDFIKMDIEGSELSALHGAKQTIQRFKPRLAISVYHRLSDFTMIPEFLDSLGCKFGYFLRHYTIHTEETVLFAVTTR